MATRRYVAREERVGATEQTAAKLRRDPLQLAAEAWRATDGRTGLAPEQEAAVLSIRRAYALIVAPVAVRVADYDSRGDPGHGEMTDAQARLIARYDAWAAELYRRHLSVIAALNHILDDGEREWHGSDLEAVRTYAQMWLDVRGRGK